MPFHYSNTEAEKKYQKGAQLALAALGVLIVGALIFYRERTLLNDASHILFWIINDEKLQIQQYRFGAFVTQMVPLAAVKLHLPIKAVLIAYSLSFNVFYFVTAFIIYKRFRAYALVILMSFYYLLIATETYYWTNNEVHQGVAWMFLFYAWFISSGRKNKNLLVPVILLLILGTTAIFAHPLVMIPFVFLWGFLLLEKNNWPFNTRQSIILSVFLLLIVFAKYYVSRYYAGYDNGMLSNIVKMNIGDIFQAYGSSTSLLILNHYLNNYWILAIFFIVGIITLFKKRKRLLAAWVIGFFLAFHTAICITFTWYSAMYTESELMPGIIIAAAPFVFFNLSALKYRTVILILAGTFIIRSVYIGVASAPYTRRVDRLFSVLDEMKQQHKHKLFLPLKTYTINHGLGVLWGVPEESLIASALKGDKPQRNFVLKTYNETWELISSDKNIVQTAYEPWEISRFNPNYFTIDTTEEYTYIDFEEFAKGMK